MQRISRLTSFALFALLLMVLFNAHSSHAQTPPATAAPTPQTLIVTKLADTNDGVCDSDCSLREAVTAAYSETTIRFASNVRGTLMIGNELVVYDRDVSIVGPSSKSTDLVISGNQYNRLFRTGGSVTVTPSTFTSSGQSRLAVFRLSNLTLANSALAIQATGNIIIEGVTFKDNANVGPGGASAIYTSGIAVISNSLFVKNDGGRGCGGAITNAGQLTVLNTTFVDNKAFTGGAICNGGTAEVTNGTFSGNSLQVTSDEAGKASIANAGKIGIQNTILESDANLPACQGAILDKGSNLQFPNQDCGATIAVGDPKLSPLQDNGGATWTMALLPGSAAIGKVSIDKCPSNDQRGLMLKLSSAKAMCDIGAFQINAASATSLPARGFLGIS